jgi:circadian clock protein KaiC
VRASAHSNELRRFHIDDGGIVIDDLLVGYEGLLSGRPTKGSVLAMDWRPDADDG